MNTHERLEAALTLHLPQPLTARSARFGDQVAAFFTPAAAEAIATALEDYHLALEGHPR